MEAATKTLPSYASPPLVEVAASVQFGAPKGLTLAHLGAFWFENIGGSATVKVAPPIPVSNESFDETESWFPQSIQFALTSEPDCRLQIATPDDQWMQQLQRDRLVVNWRKRNEDYPRFHSVVERLKATWEDWQKFVATHLGTPPQPNLWELTYVNRIPKGSLWDKPCEWKNVFPGILGWNGVQNNALELTGFQGQWVWECRSPRARLYIEPKPHQFNSQESLVLSLTIRGPISNPDCDLDSLMNKGREIVVTTFDEISSDAAKKLWGKL